MLYYIMLDYIICQLMQHKLHFIHTEITLGLYLLKVNQTLMSEGRLQRL